MSESIWSRIAEGAGSANEAAISAASKTVLARRLAAANEAYPWLVGGGELAAVTAALVGFWHVSLIFIPVAYGVYVFSRAKHRIAEPQTARV